MPSFATVRRWAALAVAAGAAQALIADGRGGDTVRRSLAAEAAHRGLPATGHTLTPLLAAALLGWALWLWHTERPIASPAVAALLALPVLGVVFGFAPSQAALEAGLVLLVVIAAGAVMPTGARPRWAVIAAVAAWVAVYAALLLAFAAAAPTAVRDLLTGGALLASVLAARALRRPMPLVRDASEHELHAARAIVDEHGEDSLSPFILRPDKAFKFAAGGVLAYRQVGETAVVSGDPVAPDGSAPRVLDAFLRTAHARGCRVAVYGGSERHLGHYRKLGLRAICVGEEAVVDPACFTLEGRAVRKLRQSVHRIERRGWQITARDGREIDATLETEIDAVETEWRSRRCRLLGFAMGMGEFEGGVRAHDLFLLARSPEGALLAVMRFIAHRGKLSLDTMRRVGDTPNGLNEALVCRALEVARERGIAEVSLNYAGLAHVVRHECASTLGNRIARRLLVGALGRRFQMERLVRFNAKFSPEWRRRYLVYESRFGLPRSVFRVLQAEGYIPHREGLRRPGSGGVPRRPLRAAPRVQSPADEAGR
jgi:lysyl-tRNA synthetase class 2